MLLGEKNKYVEKKSMWASIRCDLKLMADKYISFLNQGPLLTKLYTPTEKLTKGD